MEQKREITPPYKKGVDIPKERASEIWEFIITRGRDDLKDTAFVTGSKITARDIGALKGFYQEVFDYQRRVLGVEAMVFNESLREHLLLSERIGKLMAPLVGLDSYLLTGLLLMHDFGRLFSHRRGRNDAIGKSLEGIIGFDRKFISLLPLDTLWVDTDEASVLKSLKEVTEKDGGVGGAIILIDVMAKWRDRSIGKLRDYKDITPMSRARQNLPDVMDMWPSELRRQIKITSEEGDRSISVKYDFLRDWFERKSQTKIDDFISRVEDSLRLEPIQESWV